MAKYGIVTKRGQGGNRLEIQCKHQTGVLYAIPGEGSWVCSPEHIHAHSLAGFMKELVDLQDLRIQDLMQRWGLYFREGQLTESDAQ